MAISVRCACGREYETADANAGRRAMCPDCGDELVIPKPEFPGEVLVLLERVRPKTSRQAVVSLVLGIIAAVGLFLGHPAALACLPAVIVGWLGLKDISRSKHGLRGRIAAIGGILFGSSVMVIACISFHLSLLRDPPHRVCRNNLKGIGLAMHNYHDQYGRFPAAAIFDTNGRPLLSWRVAVLPHMNQETLYRKFRLNEPWDSPHNKTLLSEMPSAYSCPVYEPEEPGTTHCQVIVGPGMMFTGAPEGASLKDVTDGTSRTILAVETLESVPWTAPHDLCFTTASTLAFCDSKLKDPGGFDSIFADGSIKFIRSTLDRAVFWSLLTRNGGETVSEERY